MGSGLVGRPARGRWRGLLARSWAGRAPAPPGSAQPRLAGARPDSALPWDFVRGAAWAPGGHAGASAPRVERGVGGWFSPLAHPPPARGQRGFDRSGCAHQGGAGSAAAAASLEHPREAAWWPAVASWVDTFEGAGREERPGPPALAGKRERSGARPARIVRVYWQVTSSLGPQGAGGRGHLFAPPLRFFFFCASAPLDPCKARLSQRVFQSLANQCMF